MNPASWFDLICTLAQGMIVGCIVWLCFYYWVKSMAKEMDEANEGGSLDATDRR